MASLPTLEEVENEILRIYAAHSVRPGEMLMVQNFLASLDHNRFRTSDLANGFQSLSDKRAIELKEGKSTNAIFLTESGYKLLPSSGASPAAGISTGGGSPVIHVSGANARVNINSTDNSTNTVNLGQALLDNVISDLEALPAQPGKDLAVEAAKELKAHQGKPTFAEKYRALVATVSQHASIFKTAAPYLGELLDMLGP